MELNYIILAHRLPKNLSRLILRLQDDNTYFYVHIDKKRNIAPFQDELKELNNIFILEERIDVIWSDITGVQATLVALKKIIEHKRNGYCILASGQDYPIKPIANLRNFLKAYYGQNYIDLDPIENVWKENGYKKRIFNYNIHPFPKLRTWYAFSDIYSSDFYTIKNLKNITKLILNSNDRSVLKYVFVKRRHPDYLKPFGGSAWWALPIETISEILKFINSNKSFEVYHKYTHVPDEIFFHSIIAHLIPKEKISSSLTYVNWERENCSLPVTFQTDEDFEELAQTDRFLARKFEGEIAILDKIDRELLKIKI
jgi:hypothetical protein